MFYFRINRIKLVDNKTGTGLFHLGTDEATVQLWSLIIDGNIELPNLEELMSATDLAKKKQITAELVSRVAALRTFTPIESVKDNTMATFGDTGYVLFQAREIPDDFNWEFVAVKLNDKTRDIGREMDAVINNPAFDSFANSLPVLIGRSINPAYAAGVEVSKFILSMVVKSLVSKKDQQLGLLYMSLDRWEHYPHGIRNSTNVSDLTGNMSVDYTIFAFDEQKAVLGRCL
jgi:hypothetical protein